MSEPKMLIYAQCGRRHYPTDDVTANVAAYKEAFGLPPETKLLGRVHREFDESRNPTDAGEPIETALASAAELAVKASERAAHEVSGPPLNPSEFRGEAETNETINKEKEDKDTAYCVRGSLREEPHA
ncbi:MAG TPA: hypothetical protein VFG04_20440 [Planctomycetaceae bacterium]|jgi:hypothetical protein|nr:hypothetical protein [Planctomycetaceae bacterium]